MRKGLALWSAMLFLAAPAAAQDAPGSSLSLLAPASAPAARSSRPGPFERYSWQLGFGYSFVRFNQAFTGESVSLNGNSAQRVRDARSARSEEHTSELQSRPHLVCRLLLEKKNNQ